MDLRTLENNPETQGNVLASLETSKDDIYLTGSRLHGVELSRSMSRNVIATRKNFIEKGNRAELLDQT